MTSNSGIPRPFGLTDAKRAREEEARRREQATSARNTSSTTVGSGGRLDVVGGDFTVSEGGNASVKDGGAFRVEGGGSMTIVDDGVVKVVGSTLDPIAGVTVAEAAFQAEEIYHSSAGVTTRSPGLFFKTESATGGAIRSSWGDDVSVDAGMRLVDYGPLVEPGVYKSASTHINPGSAGLYASAFFSTTPDFADQRSQCYFEVYPDSLDASLYYAPLGEIGSIRVSITDPKLRLSGRDGVDVKGPFTVDGAPVGGAVDSVAGKTGAVTLVKGDVGLGSVDNTSDANKPVSTAMGTALNAKAPLASPAFTGTPTGITKAHVGLGSVDNTSDANKPVSAATQTALNALTSGPTMTSPPLLIYRRNALLTLPSGYLGNVPWDAADEDAALYGADSGRMYVTVAGVYAFSCFITINDPTKTGNRQVVVKKNGTNYTGTAGPPNPANFAGSFSTPIRMAVGDYLEVVAYQNSGSNATLYASGADNSYNNASMQWLRP